MDTPTVFPLTPVESIQATFKTIQVILVFNDPKADEKLDSVDSKISIEQLKSSFEKLIEFYPLLQGHIDPVLSDEIRTVQVNEADRMKHLFTSIIEDGISVEEFHEIRYRRELWPANIEKHLSKEAKPDLSKLVLATVVRFRNGYLISLTVNHMLADSVGVSILLEQWGSLSRNGNLKREVDFGHERYWSKLMNPHTPDTHSIYEYTSGVDSEQVKAAQELITTVLKAHKMPEGSETAPCILHVPKAGIDQLALDFNKGSLDEKPIHGIQILYALLWQRYVETAHLAHGTPPMEADEMVYLTMVHNTRKLVDGCGNFIGNSVTPKLIGISSSEFEAMSTIDLARHVKSHINNITPGAAAAFSKEISRPDYDLHLRTIILLQRPECRCTISNISRLPFLDIDFGCGTPEAALWGNKSLSQSSMWMPLKDGGVDVYLGLDEPMLEMLPSDKVLSKYCQFANI